MSRILASTEVYSKINTAEPEELREAKLDCARYWKFARDLIFSIKTIPVVGLGTMAVNKRLQLYYDPEYIKSSGATELRSCILHELCHILFKHHARIKVLLSDPAPNEWDKWNIAADLSVNYLLHEEFNETSCHGNYGFRVGYDWLMVGKGQYRDIGTNLSAEKIFREIMKGEDNGQSQDSNDRSNRTSDTGKDNRSSTRFQREDNDDPSNTGESDSAKAGAGRTEGGDTPDEREDRSAIGSGSGDQRRSPERASDDGRSAEQPETGASNTGQLVPRGDGTLQWTGEPIPRPGCGGSSPLTGQPVGWELPEISTGNPTVDTLTDEEVEALVVSASHKIQGALGSYHTAFLKDVVKDISPITEDVWSKVIRMVRGKLNSFKDRGGKRSYRRINRRGIGFGLCRPVKRGGKPKLAICIDTSASMSTDDFDKAFATVQHLVKHFNKKEKVTIVTGDTELKEINVLQGSANLNDIKNICMKGGGGTDVGLLIQQTAEQSSPDIVIAITDGYTPWPDSSFTIPYMAVLTRTEDELRNWADDMPEEKVFI